MKKEFKISAVNEGRYYKHFGIHEKTACLYGVSVDQIEQITMIVSDDQDRPGDDYTPLEPDYWGWVDEKEELTFVYSQFFLLNMCFPSGIDMAEKIGRGKAYRLEIKP